MALRRAIAIFLPTAVLATCLCVLIYLVVQQELRTGANDPQQQLAEDAAAALNAGVGPSGVVTGPKVDVARSLAPFVAVYDSSSSVLATDGQLDGGPPMIPSGVFASARSSGLDAVTWQPRAGVRIATVSVPWSGGTVTAGRSLRVVGQRESNLELIVGAAWVVTLIALAIGSLVANSIWAGSSNTKTTS